MGHNSHIVILETSEDLKFKHHFTLVEHPKTNEQAKIQNNLRGLKQRIMTVKGNWMDELLHVLWAFTITPLSTTNEKHLPVVI